MPIFIVSRATSPLAPGVLKGAIGILGIRLNYVYVLSKILFQSVINQENDRTTRYAPRDCDATASVKASNTLRTIHRHERPSKRLFGRYTGPISRRGTKFLGSLYGAFHTIRREQREVKGCTGTRT